MKGGYAERFSHDQSGVIYELRSRAEQKLFGVLMRVLSTAILDHCLTRAGAIAVGSVLTLRV